MEKIKTLFDNIKFELNWNYNFYIYSPLITFFNGISNFWKFRKEIYNWNFYDYAFLHNTLRARLYDMKIGYKTKAYSCIADDVAKELEDLINILDEIKEIEDDDFEDSEDWIENDKKIDFLYQEFGEKLFKIRTFYNKDCEGKIENEVETNFIRRLWD